MADKLRDDFITEAVLDKGYHSKQTLVDLEAMDIRSYASEPDRGRQNWNTDADEETRAMTIEARDAVYAKRRRIKGERGRRLLRSRGEKLSARSRIPTKRGICDGSTCAGETMRQARADPGGGLQPGAADAGAVRIAEARSLIQAEAKAAPCSGPLRSSVCP